MYSYNTLSDTFNVILPDVMYNFQCTVHTACLIEHSNIIYSIPSPNVAKRLNDLTLHIFSSEGAAC